MESSVTNSVLVMLACIIFVVQFVSTKGHTKFYFYGWTLFSLGAVTLFTYLFFDIPVVGFHVGVGGGFKGSIYPAMVSSLMAFSGCFLLLTDWLICRNRKANLKQSR